ncbi:hypothetical protein SJI19_07150 [Acerihabitans sp. TG2]|uniref:hypothetical protein n=1 Tax=Acerihabitans sp. TG2 TaxID=3096008 RepID=UPI002B222C1F|nr:hypothetical protein [Acerihabitans sp. TG2]MEA9390319.1 hypothetical protein [Acerihabitans sp. TG2]
MSVVRGWAGVRLGCWPVGQRRVAGLAHLGALGRPGNGRFDPNGTLPRQVSLVASLRLGCWPV